MMVWKQYGSKNVWYTAGYRVWWDILIILFFRWNFNSFFHALMLIFRILCGEWIEELWNCMRAADELCMVVFLPTLVFGYFIVSASSSLYLSLQLYYTWSWKTWIRIIIESIFCKDSNRSFKVCLTCISL